MSSTPLFTLLSHEGLLSIRGIDAKQFLQGQLTCNLNYLDDARSSLGARCTPKGRMLSNFRIVQEADGYLLAMDKSLVELQLNELKKYAVFSKSTLTDATEQWVRFGLYQPEPMLEVLGIELAKQANSVAHANQMLAIRINDDHCELWADADYAACLHKRLANHMQETDLNFWKLGLIRAGIGLVNANTSDSFIPQLFNMPALDAVSFKKGCYTGQEIVARMQYLGKLKRHLHRFLINTDQLPKLGTSIVSATSKGAVGEIVSAALNETQQVEILAIVPEQAFEADQLIVDNDQGLALQLLDLPYSIDADKEIQR
ncbi:folate-binding protein [Pseudomonas sp. F1_0610]|uniref:CAF17-like 4Fe-4S cluster assembly/insertion protein YgfZ n=1 Tax=Pseudomonas sp. F1_0610 TaxID=3114284 RepID=UPI0039C377BD